MRNKTPAHVKVLFLAIVPISAWIAVIYFVLVLVGAATFSLDLFAKLLALM